MVVRGAELSALDEAGLVVRGVDFGADVVADGLVVAVVRGADGLVVAVVRGTDGFVVMVVRGAELSALDEAGLVVRGVDFGADVVADGLVVAVVRGAELSTLG